jgi:hypothetical protein
LREEKDKKIVKFSEEWWEKKYEHIKEEVELI